MTTRGIVLLSVIFILVGGFDRSKLIDGSPRRLRKEQLVTDNRVVKLLIGNYTCSGFIAGKNIIATAAHCVHKIPQGSRQIVQFIDSPPVNFKTLVVGSLIPGSDYALLSADTGDRSPVEFNFVPLHAFTIVHVIGHPHGVPEEILSTGMVMHVGEMIVLAGVNYPGESGSPLFTEEGLVVGIVSAISLRAPVTYVTPIRPVVLRIPKGGAN